MTAMTAIGACAARVTAVTAMTAMPWLTLLNNNGGEAVRLPRRRYVLSVHRTRRWGERRFGLILSRAIA